MRRFRSILSLFLVAIAVFLVSCSSPSTVVKGPTYTAAQLAQIQDYAADVEELRERMLEIPGLVQKDQWTDVDSFIHGPLGDLRILMSRLARSLEPKVQKEAQQAAKDVFEHLILIDEATQTGDRRKALLNYNEALKDFDTFFELVPMSAS